MDDALVKAGCKPGDEVRIVGYAFDFEGAGDLDDDDYEDDVDYEALALDDEDTEE